MCARVSVPEATALTDNLPVVRGVVPRRRLRFTCPLCLVKFSLFLILVPKKKCENVLHNELKSGGTEGTDCKPY